MKLQCYLSRSLNAKLLMMLMLVALFTSISTAVIFSFYELNTVTKAERSRLTSIADILAPNLTAAVIFQDEYTVKELIKPLLSQSNVVSARVLDVNGNSFGEVLAEQRNEVMLLTDIINIRFPLKIDGVSYGTLEITADHSLVERSLFFFGRFLLAILALILTCSFFLSLVLRKSLIHPLIHLTSVADQITKTRKYSMRAEVLSNDEVGHLTHCFNSMLETIEQREHILEIQVLHRTNALKLANNQLSRQANSDELSGLPNRRYIIDKLTNLISSNNLGEGHLNGISDQTFAVLNLDLDGFKEINDSLGHDYGDLLLIAVSKRIAGALPDNAMLSRLGGDEFIVLIENIDCKSAIEIVVEKIQTAINDSFMIKGKAISITTSIGISIYPDDGVTVETIVKYADLAMYKSKATGRNRHHYFHPDMLENLVSKRALIDDLRSGLSNGEFELYYQPIIDLESNVVYKAEALIRWHHPTRGLVPPIEFIAVAEETGLIREMGEWVARTASKALAEIRNAGQSNFQISINVSPLQFKGDGKWMSDWFDYMAELGLSRDAIIVEITENLLMESEDSIRSKLIKLKDHGTSIAIDDFGVGYSSLSYLQEMDVDILKIDKSFVDNLSSENNSQDLCSAMIIMARHLNIQVVAEGIENEQQRDILKRAGCKFGQGYLFSKPIPLAAFKAKYFNPHLAEVYHLNAPDSAQL